MSALLALTLSDLETVLYDLSRGGEECVPSGKPVGLPARHGDDVAQLAEGKSSSRARSDGAPARRRVNIVRSVHRDDPLGPRYTVLVAGEYYQVNKYLLASLEAGITPQRLDLEPIQEDEEELYSDEGWSALQE